MDNITNIIDKHLYGNAFQSAVITTDKIIFSEYVVKACASNHCGKYNTCWTCPPAVGNLETLKDKYTKYKWAYVFTTLHKIEDSFDIEGMDISRTEHQKVQDIVIKALQGYNIDWLGAGSCTICKKCTYPNFPCRFPDEAKPSVEACGIDAVQLAKTCKIDYYNGDSTVTYFSVIFYGEKS